MRGIYHLLTRCSV